MDFFKFDIFKKFFQDTIISRVSSSLDPDQAQHFVGSDLGSKFLFVKDISRSH